MPRVWSGKEVSSAPPRLLLHLAPPAERAPRRRAGGRRGAARAVTARPWHGHLWRVPRTARCYRPPGAEGRRRSPCRSEASGGEPGTRRRDRTKRLLRPRLCSRRGTETSALQQPPSAIARPQRLSSPGLTAPPISLSPPRRRRSRRHRLLPWLSQPPASSAALRPPWRPCGKAERYGRRGPPRPFPSTGAHTLDVLSRPVPTRLTATTAAVAEPPAPPSSSPRKHAAGESDVWPPAPPPPPAASPSGRSERLRPPAPGRPRLTPQPPPEEWVCTPPGPAGRSTRSGSRGPGNRGGAGQRHRRAHPPPHPFSLPQAGRRGAFPSHKEVHRRDVCNLMFLWYKGLNAQYPGSARVLPSAVSQIPPLWLQCWFLTVSIFSVFLAAACSSLNNKLPIARVWSVEIQQAFRACVAGVVRMPTKAA